MSIELELKTNDNENLYPNINIQKVIDIIYPIGSVYITVNDISPQILFGGIWEQISKGRTLVGVDDSDFDFNIEEKWGGRSPYLIHTIIQQ